jgi:hypothetical protein
MLFLRHGTIRGGRKERPVNVLAIYIANEHIQSLMEENVTRSMAYRSVSGPSLRDRIASATAGLRRLVGNSTQTAGVLPKLGNNPYRG